MKSKISQLFYFFIAFAPVLLLSFGLIGGHVFINSKTSPVNLTSDILGVSALEKFVDIPVRLKIPAINVNASIQRVGLDQDGEMGVPENPKDVGWLDLETLSGSVGSAVISGHLNQENGEPGVFANLNKLQVGETIFLEKANSNLDAYRISKIRTYDSGHAEEVFGIGGGERLSFVTCDGVWNKNIKSYSKRLVVTALPVP